MSSAQVRHVISWILVVLLAAAFGLAALGKLSGAATDMFAGWGYPAWFAMLIGVLEIAGALGLLVPKNDPLRDPGAHWHHARSRLHTPGERRRNAGPAADHLPGGAVGGVVAATAVRRRRAIRSVARG